MKEMYFDDKKIDEKFFGYVILDITRGRGGLDKVVPVYVENGKIYAYQETVAFSACDPEQTLQELHVSEPIYLYRSVGSFLKLCHGDG